MNVSVLCAFPHELKPFRRSLCTFKPVKSPYKTYEAHYRSSRMVLVETGLGGEAAKKTLLHHVALQEPDMVISAGYCGALDRELPVGTVILATSSMRLGNTGIIDSVDIPLPSSIKDVPAGIRRGTVVTLEQWMAKRAVRQLLPSTLTLPVCDMETCFLAKLCLARAIPFVAIRSVSDSGRTEIPCELLNACDHLSGIYSPKNVFSILAANPLLAPKMITLGVNARKAAGRLSRAIIAILDGLL